MNMNPLKVLSRQALLGTQRAPLQLPTLDPDFAALAAAACPPDQDDALRLLRLAGILGLGEAAGYQPPPQAAPVAPSVAAPDMLPVLPDGPRQAALVVMLADAPERLVHHALLALAREGLLLPPALLPRALTLGARSRGLRVALFPVLGARGAWLARINPEWNYAQGADGARLGLEGWETATQAERLSLIKTARPGGLPELLPRVQADWSTLSAAEKLGMLDALEPALLDTDAPPLVEAFLAPLLTERSKEVRGRAALLLSALDLDLESGLPARMARRGAALLGQTPDGQWEITPPTAFEPDWKQDALEPKLPKSESLGERAWWLYQLARHLPLAWWTRHLGLDPAALVAWARGGDWSAPLLRAWGERILLQPDAVWAEALLDVVLAPKPIPGMQLTAEKLLSQLTPPVRILCWRRLWEERGQNYALTLVRQVMDAQPPGESMNADFSRWLWDACLGCLPAAAKSWDYSWRQELQELVCVLAPDALPEALPVLEERARQFYEEALIQVLKWAGLRRSFGI